MNTKAGITCSCGHKIAAKDVVQKGQYLRLFGPSFIYVKYRCSHCKRMGERFIDQEKWDETLLREVPSDLDVEEKRQFDMMGPITEAEVSEFQARLKNFRYSDLNPDDDAL